MWLGKQNQAIDRAHRFGQTKEVKVYKITIINTVEEKILELQLKKQEIANAAIDGGDVKKLNKLSEQGRLFHRCWSLDEG